jgi:hypothetical protein
MVGGRRAVRGQPPPEHELMRRGGVLGLGIVAGARPRPR